MDMSKSIASLCLLIVGTVAVGVPPAYSQQREGETVDVASQKGYGTHFQISDRCVPCHNGMTTSSGEDISIGVNWRASMMGNSGRDPYWMAGVRRETIDHPTAINLIEDECTICHMPMMRYEAKLAGGEGKVFSHLPPDPGKLGDRLAADGVSCSVCHQILPDNLGTPESLVGRFKIDETSRPGERHEFGPFDDVDKGHTTIMHSSSTFEPKEGTQIRSAELCATCHTLLTKALDAQGNVIGELPEQVPYQEWAHSDYKDQQTCQACHMPVVEEEVPITSVFGEPRKGFSRHTFVGANFLLQRILNRYRKDLGVVAEPQELDAAINRTLAHLQSKSATIEIRDAEVRNGRLQAGVHIENLSGHKLPTAYPSRRVWLHFTVRDRNGGVVFESGALTPSGLIRGNDNDADPARFEPHYKEIRSSDEVQIYESIMVDGEGAVTTGLLRALRYEKDNRLLPRGFDKTTADQQIAVVGGALQDTNFQGGEDEVRYDVDVSGGEGPFSLEAELWYQPVGYRWAMNLRPYDAPEPKRFVSYYESMSDATATILARAAKTAR